MISSVVVFETAYLIQPYDNDLGSLYSHSYRMEVTVSGKKDRMTGMIIRYEDLAKIVYSVVPDHQFIFYNKDHIGSEISSVLRKYDIPYLQLPFIITAENLVNYFAEEIEVAIHNFTKTNDISVVEVKLSATDSEDSAIYRKKV